MESDSDEVGQGYSKCHSLSMDKKIDLAKKCNCNCILTDVFLYATIVGAKNQSINLVK
jgi:hypothetical protein